MRQILILFILILFSLGFVLAEDSTDTLLIEQEIRIPDSLLSMPLYSHGQIFQSNFKSFRKINKSDIQLENYISISDIIDFSTPFYSMNLGSYSTFNSFSAFGAMPKSNSFGFNGRNINDLDFGSLNPEQFSTEFFENIEIFIGSDAAILGDNASSTYINFQEIRYNTANPFTKLWFGNSSYGYLGVDGIYSQNVAPNLNFTFGFRSFNSDGWFEDSWSNHWNVRGILRWNPDNLTSISLVENFNNMGGSANGGIEIGNSSDIFEELTAEGKFEGLDERVFRHDITLSATRKFDTLGKNSIDLSLYFSAVDWDRTAGSILQFDEADTNNSVYKNNYNYFGANAKYNFSPIDEFQLTLGATAEYDILDKSYYYNEYNGLSNAVFAHSQFKMNELINLSGGVRVFSKFGNSGISFGVKNRTIFSEKSDLFIDFSRAERLPYLSEGIDLKSEKHTAVISEFSYKFEDNTKFILGAYYRNISSPILAKIIDNFSYGNYLSYYNGNELNRVGAYIEFSKIIFSNFTIVAKVLSQLGLDEDDNLMKDFPMFNANFKAFYTYDVGKSKINIGLESGFLTNFKGDYFYPLERAFYAGDYESGFMITGVNAFAQVKIGDAFVKVSVNNLLDNDYYFVAVNQMFTRSFRLTASWAFIE